MAKNLTDENQVAEHNKNVNLKNQQWKEDLRFLMKNGAGRRVLWKILNKSNMLAPNLFAIETNTAYYRMGQRDMGVWLYNELISSDINSFKEMLTDNQTIKGDNNG